MTGVQTCALPICFPVTILFNNPDKCVFKNKDKQQIAMNMGHELHKRARKELFDIMENHIEGWWDWLAKLLYYIHVMKAILEFDLNDPSWHSSSFTSS